MHNFTQNKTQDMALKIQTLAWDSHKYVAGSNQLMGFQHNPTNTGGVSTITIWIEYKMYKNDKNGIHANSHNKPYTGNYFMSVILTLYILV